MTRLEFETLRTHCNGLTREERIELKENEIDRLSYDSVDPLNIMIHLDSLKLFWY